MWEYRWEFTKWYRVELLEHIEHIVSLFLDKGGDLDTWNKYYPTEYKFNIVNDPELINQIWELASSVGIKTNKEEKEKIINLLKRGGKVYFHRNGKPGIFFIDSKGILKFSGRLDIEELLEMKHLFVNKKTLPSSALLPNFSAVKTESQHEVSTEIENLFPKYESELSGSQEIRIYNPNDFTVYVAIRKNMTGTNLIAMPRSKCSAYVSNGEYDIYFIYSDKPYALFQGDSFTLDDNGLEIQLVKVVGGNYGIRRVK